MQLVFPTQTPTIRRQTCPNRRDLGGVHAPMSPTNPPARRCCAGQLAVQRRAPRPAPKSRPANAAAHAGAAVAMILYAAMVLSRAVHAGDPSPQRDTTAITATARAGTQNPGAEPARGQQKDPVPEVVGRVYHAAGPEELRAIVFFAPAGELTGWRADRPNVRSDSGAWWITDDGRLCRRWTRWDAARVRCAAGRTAIDAVRRLMVTLKDDLTWARGPGLSDVRHRQPGSPVRLADTLLSQAARTVHPASTPERPDGARSAAQAASTHPFALSYGVPGPLPIRGLNALIARSVGADIDPTEQIAGYVASVLVLLTFCTREMLPLRCMAILSNLAFMIYGYLAVLPPVFFLHLILLPINAIRLEQLLQKRPSVPARDQALDRSPRRP